MSLIERAARQMRRVRWERSGVADMLSESLPLLAAEVEDVRAVLWAMQSEIRDAAARIAECDALINGLAQRKTG